MAAESSNKVQRSTKEEDGDEIVAATVQEVPRLGAYMVLCEYRSTTDFTQISKIAMSVIWNIEHHPLLGQMAIVSLKEPKGAKVSGDGAERSINYPLEWIEARFERHNSTFAFAGDESEEH